jgi:hypothetical protein
MVAVLRHERRPLACQSRRLRYEPAQYEWKMNVMTASRRVQRQGRAKLERQCHPRGPPEGFAPFANHDFRILRALLHEMRFVCVSNA